MNQPRVAGAALLHRRVRKNGLVPASAAAREHQMEDAQVFEAESITRRRHGQPCSVLLSRVIEHKMNSSTANHAVQWLFLDLNAFFASCEQQQNPVLRGKPVIVVQTQADSAVAIAASYAAKATRLRRKKPSFRAQVDFGMP